VASNHSIPHRNLLRRAALASPAAALAAWGDWVRGGPAALADPASRQWLPLVWWNLREAELDEASREALWRSHREAWAANLRLLAGALPAVQALERAGIETLLLKGVALAFTVYARPGLRAFGDADVLVETGAVPEARALLGRLGWQPIRPVAESTQRLRHSLGFTNVDGVRVDLHWHALAECCAEDADRGFWQRAETLRLGALTTRVLCPSDQLLHVCIHGLRWSGGAAELWIADAAKILRRAGAAFDWDLLVEEARCRRLTFQLGRALECLRQTAAIEVPARVTRSLTARPPGWQERVEYRAKMGPPTAVRLLFLFWCAHARATPERSTLSRVVTFARYIPGFAGRPRRR
jgi:Uncharacterised nucleotidyltransferase